MRPIAVPKWASRSSEIIRVARASTSATEPFTCVPFLGLRLRAQEELDNLVPQCFAIFLKSEAHFTQTTESLVLAPRSSTELTQRSIIGAKQKAKDEAERVIAE
jgi:hypothetical protein